MQIDTEYKGLSDIDPEIVRFYEEVLRTRTTGYEVGEDGETSTPITEEYTVVVQNKPAEVPFSYAEERRARRLNDVTVNAAITAAILWEDFDINHDGYLDWKAAYSLWEVEQPTELVEDLPIVVPAPVRPVVTLDARRAVYKVVTTPTDPKVERQSAYNDVYDDTAYTTTRTHDTAPHSPEIRRLMDMQQAHNYLAATDWMAARMVETGQAVPDDVVAKRASARTVLDNTFTAPDFDL